MSLTAMLRRRSETIADTVLTEAASDRIDESAGVIRNVRVLGRQSQNDGGRREYSDQALNDAVRLYEGLDVNIDHPQAGKEANPRGVLESWGVLRKVRREGDSVRGDLHYIPEHAATPVLLSRIRRGMTVGLSHNAVGRTVHRGGKVIVEGLAKARSADMVLKPATNSDLFEQEEEQVTLAEFVESLADDALPSERALLENLAGNPLAGKAMMPAPQYGEQGGMENPDAQIKSAYGAALSALADAADVGSLKKAIEVLMGTSSEKPGDDASKGKAPEKKPRDDEQSFREQLEALTEQVSSQGKELSVLRFMQTQGLAASVIGKERVELLEQAPDDAARTKLVESWPPAVRGHRPPPAKLGNLTEQAESVPNNRAGVTQVLRSR